MSVRIGVDVGGTFTKAVACSCPAGEVVARAVVPTTHAGHGGVADGVVQALGEVAAEVRARDLGPIQLVAHSTTQAVNALLEGDTSVVGVLGIGRRPDLKRARRRTAIGEVRLAPGHSLATRHAFIDATDGIDHASVRRAIQELLDSGAEVLCVSEAFGVEDARGERLAVEVAREMGLPAGAGHELTGLYGLEMRTVTAALNASILPKALHTAHMVEKAVGHDAPEVPLLVMRGDGGAVGLESMKRHPLLTAFSGPAGSVAGALHRASVRDGVVVEVGGTSTNVSTIKGGRPVLSYVRVQDHVTCVRSLDVRVVGVAGGSMLRVGRRLGQSRLTDVGPRSAHIAGLAYSCFSSRDELEGSTPLLVSPRPGDPNDYLVLETTSGRHVALTLTCAANALGEVADTSYAVGDPSAALHGFRIAGGWLGTDPLVLARAALEAATRKVTQVVIEAGREHGLSTPELVGLGGGAGALIPAIARATGWGWRIPSEAEVISSIGDALSLVRVEVERTLPRPDPDAIAVLLREAQERAVDAGADPRSIHVESEAIPDRGALRVTAFGAVSLEANGIPDKPARTQDVVLASVGESATEVPSNGFYSVFAENNRDGGRFVVIDRLGAIAAQGRGTILAGRGREVASALQERIPALVRHFGIIGVAPAVRILRGAGLIDLSLISSADAVLEAALAECALGYEENVVALLSRK